MNNVTPRPLMMWKSFWLGILVLGFLGWARWDSVRYETSWQFEGDSGVCGVIRLAGVTIVFDQAPDDIFGTGFSRYSGNSPLEEVEAEWTRWEVRYLKVPDSFVIVAFLVAWSAWLGWHWKREQRKLTP